MSLQPECEELRRGARRCSGVAQLPEDLCSQPLSRAPYAAGVNTNTAAACNPDTWESVDAYFTETLVRREPALDQALDAAQAACDGADMPAISVSAPVGKLLSILASAMGARRILEIGTLAGYSTIWLARALPRGGQLVTLELDPRHAEVARSNIARAGLAHCVDVRVGRAIDSLAALHAEGAAPFDFVFVDADKPSNSDYFEWAMRMSRSGTVIVIDNFVRKGEVANPASQDASVMGVRRVAQRMADEPRVRATALQTVGTKGYDGFAVALVVG